MTDTIYLTSEAEVEPTDEGFRITEGDDVVHLTDVLAERFCINVMASERRAGRVAGWKQATG